MAHRRHGTVVTAQSCRPGLYPEPDRQASTAMGSNKPTDRSDTVRPLRRQSGSWGRVTLSNWKFLRKVDEIVGDRTPGTARTKQHLQTTNNDNKSSPVSH